MGEKNKHQGPNKHRSNDLTRLQGIILSIWNDGWSKYPSGISKFLIKII